MKHGMNYGSHGKDNRYGESAHPDEKFKSNSNMGMTGGVVPFQVQHGHNKPAAGRNKPGSARGHGSGKSMGY